MKLINTNKFYLKGTNNRFLHLATIEDGPKEYMCFYDKRTSSMYIEEITGGTLMFIQDEQLAFELTKFLEYNKVIDISKPTLSDQEWNPLNEKRKIF